MYFFTSPTSSITLPPVPHPSPAYTSTAMSRSDSRDSTTSTASFASTGSTDTFYQSTSPSAWDFSMRSHSSTSFRRDSSSSQPGRELVSGWIPSPYRSCQLRSSSFTSEPSSFISDEDLAMLSPTSAPDSEHDQTPTEMPTSAPRQKELSTEEQIEILRAQRERDDYVAQQQVAREKKARMVRFADADKGRRASTGGASSGAKRPTSQLKRRSTAVRRNLAMMT